MSDNFARYPSLAKKHVLITGGASGIGAEMVASFVEQGSDVSLIDIDEVAIASLNKQLAPATCRSIVCDITDTLLLKSKIESLISENGPIDVLVNNAARDDRHNWQDVTEDEFDARIATNIKHMFFATQAVAPAMIKNGCGSIINMGSNSWWEAVGGFPVYTTSKAAVHGLTRSMARDLGKHRIRVNTVVPGWIMTKRQKELWATPEALERQIENQCIPDLIDPKYVARMVLFLASDDAMMCTANNYMVEAGSI